MVTDNVVKALVMRCRMKNDIYCIEGVVAESSARYAEHMQSRNVECRTWPRKSAEEVSQASCIHRTRYAARQALSGVCQGGAYATRQPRRLAESCSRRPATEAQRNVLRRLTAGQPPTTAAYLEEVAAANGGVRGSAESHADILAWRRGADVIGPMGRALNRDRGRSGHHCRDATPPTGVYARLKGGSLYRGPPAETPAVAEDADAHVVRDARLKRDKLEHPSVEGPRVGDVRGATTLCMPSSGTGWSRRLRVGTTPCAQACNACAHPTRSTCRGCGRGICVNCARDGTPRASSDASASTDQTCSLETFP